jgi:hypothetical protein
VTVCAVRFRAQRNRRATTTIATKTPRPILALRNGTTSIGLRRQTPESCRHGSGWQSMIYGRRASLVFAMRPVKILLVGLGTRLGMKPRVARTRWTARRVVLGRAQSTGHVRSLCPGLALVHRARSTKRHSGSSSESTQPSRKGVLG